MSLYFRLLFLLLRRALGKKSLDVFETCETQFRVNPLDLDVNLHMNNGRYLSIMDLGRVDLMLKAGVFWRLLRNRYYPVVASESIRFNKSFELFQKITLKTRLSAWDDKDMYVTQVFMRGPEVIAIGVIRARFRQIGQKGSVPTSKIFSIAGKENIPLKTSELSKIHMQVETSLMSDIQSLP